MKGEIKAILKDIELKNNIKILFSVESGSRVWGMESKNSDYDVRFVFIRPINDYLKINKIDEVIIDKASCTDFNFTKKRGLYARNGTELDFVGFDIYKFCKLLYDSNPTVIEWLMSSITYYGKIPEALITYAEMNHNRKSLFMHYKGMCKKNYIKYLKSKNLVTYKKYLYSMRGLINAVYCEEFPTMLPPIKLEDTIWDLESRSKEIPKQILNNVKKLIKLKKQGKEKNSIKNIIRLDNYIEGFLKEEGYKGQINYNVSNKKTLNQFILKKFNKNKNKNKTFI